MARLVDRAPGWAGGVVAALLLAFTSPAHGQEPGVEERSLDMEVGDQIWLPLTDVKEWSPGIAGIIEDRPNKDKTHLVLVALAPGSTTFLFILKSGQQVRYTITVRPREPPGTVKPKPNIRLDFYYVMLSSDHKVDVGIGWPGTIGGTAAFSASSDLVAHQNAASASIAAQVLPRIDLAQARGRARILRQASLVVMNGGQGTFSSGGEINVLVEGKLATGIEKIKSGMDVVVKPRYDVRSGRSEIQLTADVSALTESGGTLPGRTVSRVDTIVNLEQGQSIILAGLHGNSEVRSRSGLPLLSQIPILGALFGIHTHQAIETEDLIFIVPSIIEPVSTSKRDLIMEAYRAYEQFEGQPGAVRNMINETSRRESMPFGVPRR